MKDRTISQLAPIGASVVLLLGGSFMGGCAEMIECTGETYYVDGRCEPLLDGSPDAGRDASPSVDAQGPDAGPCSDCDGHCIDGRCVECTPETEATDCTEEGKSVCLDNTCVGCTDDADCTDPSKARCDQTTHTCVACQEDAECEAGLDGLPLCNDGTCVECTPQTEEEHCGTQACDPIDFVCTGTNRGTVRTCKPCLADSECVEGNRCIPLNYMGEPRGYYCMRLPSDEGCLSRPYSVELPDRRSRSGEDPAIYCGINEALTTCEAVLVAREWNGEECSNDSCPEGGRCEPVGDLGTRRCTYSCSNAAECPRDDPALSDCKSDDDRYCGRR